MYVKRILKYKERSIWQREKSSRLIEINVTGADYAQMLAPRAPWCWMKRTRLSWLKRFTVMEWVPAWMSAL
jgi:hypothetical protein